MAGASNPGNIGHAWVKALWVDKVPPAGFERPELYEPKEYCFIRARLEDNPIFRDDKNYRRKLEMLPEYLRRAFLDGDWNVFAGQYFDVFELGRHTARPEEFRLEPWWPRWISIDWGFQHPSAVYWHCAVPAQAPEPRGVSWTPTGSGDGFGGPSQFHGPDFHGPDYQGSRIAMHGSRDTEHGPRNTAQGAQIVTYREFVQPGLSPRMLGQAIAERSGREHISEIFLSPDAFAHRTAEASIAEQLAEIFTANGLPRPAPADDDRVGGWQLMYQLLESDQWVIADTCTKLIECLPLLVRDDRRSEDIRKVDGDDPADAARYGLVSGGRLAGVTAAYGAPRAGQSPPYNSAPHIGGGYGAPTHQGAATPIPGVTPPLFLRGMPLGEQIARQVTATDPTSQAIHYQRLEAEARKQLAPRKFPRRRF
jgi:hypothetical protein